MDLPVGPEQAETLVFETEASKAEDKEAHYMTAEEAVFSLSPEQVIASTSTPAPMIGSYMDTGVHLNSLVKTNSFKTEQAKKAEIGRKQAIAAEKAAKEKEDAEKAAAKAVAEAKALHEEAD